MLRVTVSRKFVADLEAVRFALSHAIPDRDLEKVIHECIRRTLRQVESALRRLDDGRYGLCAECGRAIGEARLQVLPFADLCRDCQKARERALSEIRPPVVGHRLAELAGDPALHPREEDWRAPRPAHVTEGPRTPSIARPAR